MRESPLRSVSAFDPPSADWLQSAAALPATPALHDELLSSCLALNSVRVVQPVVAPADATSVRIAAWNLERCKFVEESAEVVAKSGADIALLSEADIGMCRSGNRDTVSDLAKALGMGHATGVEFVELGLGDKREMVECAGGANAESLHCNAVLSRFKLDRAVVVPLDPGGAWFAGKPGMGQRRIGGRISIGARILLPQPLWAFSAHFESEGGPEDRAGEAERLVGAIDALCQGESAVVGGDFNFCALHPETVAGTRPMSDLDLHEPAFGVFKRAGFGWAECNAAGPTTRRHPWQEVYSPKKIDWMFVRRAGASNPFIVPAVSGNGRNLSDHEMICADFTAP